MPAPPGVLTATRSQFLLIGIAAAALTIGGFEAGRKTVDAGTVAESMATPPQPGADLVSQKETLLERDHSRITVREIASVPFSELYDVLKGASGEQLLAWAADLERLPKGPRRTAAVTAYYKSLIQVDMEAATKALLRTQNITVRDLAIDAMTKTAPESSWGELAEAIVRSLGAEQLSSRIIGNWSCTDPVAASKFMERHPETAGHGQLGLLIANWAIVDPLAAKTWMEQDPSRVTSDAISSLIQGWEAGDRPAAIEYAIANALREDFAPGINEMAYRFLRQSPAEATALIMRLPFESAQRAIAHITEQSDRIEADESGGKQNQAELIANWVTSLPPDYWKSSIGSALTRSLRLEPEASIGWVNQLRPELRDIAIADLCHHAEAEVAERAITLGFSIRDPQVRAKALGAFVRKLGQTREQAIQALENFGLPREQEDYLRAILSEAAP